MATTISSLAIPVGVSLGYILPSIMVTDSSGRSAVGWLMLVESTIVGGTTVLTLFFFSNAPPVPPSQAAQTKKEKFSEGLKQSFKNRNFVLTFLGFGLGQGTLNAFTTVVQQITGPYGYSSTDNSLFGSLAIGFGLLGSAVAGVVVTKTLRYKAVMIVILLGSGISFVVMLLTLKYGSLVFVCVSVSLLGFALMPILPIGFELGCELTFPVGEATINGIMNCSGQVIGILELLVAFAFGNSPTIIILLGISCVGVGSVLIMACKEELRRVENTNLVAKLEI